MYHVCWLDCLHIAVCLWLHDFDCIYSDNIRSLPEHACRFYFMAVMGTTVRVA